MCRLLESTAPYKTHAEIIRDPSMRRIPDPAPIGFMPLIREGELLFNAMALQRRIVDGTTLDQAIVDVRGSLSRQRNVMGTDPAIVARRVFGAGQSDPTILLRHTLSGVYCRAMPSDVERVWLQRFGHKRYRGGMCSALGLRAWKEGNICSSHLRFCGACVSADIDGRGFAAWKVLHQVTSIERCPTHGEVLANGLAPRHREKHEPPLWPLRLPSGMAPSQPDAPLPLSEGYAQYLKLWRALFRGELPAVRADRWRALIFVQTQATSSLQSLQGAIEDQIERSWEAPLAVLAKHLSLDGDATFVAHELQLRTKPKDIARRLIVYSAAMALRLFTADSDQLELNLVAKQRQDRTFGETEAERALRVAIAARGLSIKMEDALLTGGTPKAVIRSGGITCQKMNHFRRQLPTPLLEDLLRCGRFDTHSWVSCEWRLRTKRRTEP